jgi:cytochrome P450
VTDEMTSTVYYDPYDFEIDTDPYPVWKRMRDEQPLYYNEKYDFYAVSRFADVDRCLGDWKRLPSGRGTLLEMIKADLQIPHGMLIFDDPPIHDIHRSLLARVFRPKQIADLEPQIRRFCAESLDPLVGSGGFDFVTDLGAQMPMKTIGMLLGIPESDQTALRDQTDEGLRLSSDDGAPEARVSNDAVHDQLGEYVDWRAEHPSEDLITELQQAEFEDETGARRRLTRQELLNYIGMLNAAGNETTARLIGWTGKVLAENPDQRQAHVDDPGLIPNAIEELLRYESPSPVQARYVAEDVELHGQTVAAGNVLVILNGSANRDDRKFAAPDRFDVRRRIERHIAFGYGIHFCLGAALARLEGRVALEEVLNRFPTWEVDYAHAVQARTTTVRGWERMPVSVG